MITDHWLTGFAFIALLLLSLGFWLGCMASTARIKRLKTKVYFARMGL